jgi:ribokinase
MSFDAVGFGALNVDKLYRVNRIACKDEESYIKSLAESCGGSAANTIVGMSRLGLKTGFIGKVAQDEEGKLLTEHLKNEGVDTANVTLEEGRSGVVNGFVDEGGQRALYVDTGVNDLIEGEEVNESYLDSLKVLHLTSFVGKFTDKSIEAQKNLLKKISDDVCVSLDPGMLYAERGMGFLEEFLTRTNVVLINEAELNLLTGEQLTGKRGQHTLKTCHDGSQVLLEYGVSVVAVKCGERGAYVTDGNQSHFKDIFKVQCVDATGAGDAFNAGFLYGLIKGENLEKSCLMGNFVASRCVEKPGATMGLPTNISSKIF